MATSKVIGSITAVLVLLSVINCQQDMPRFPGLPDFPGRLNFPRPDGGGRPQNPGFSYESPSFASCNYTTDGGLSCVSCTKAQICLSSNVGVTYDCSGSLPYCNDGYCSDTPEESCSAITTTTTTFPPPEK